MTSWTTLDKSAPEANGSVTRPLELIATMAADFASSRDLETTLSRAVARITRHLNAASGALFMLDETGEELRCHACYGETDITGLVLGAREGIVGRCVQGRRGEIVHDVNEDPGFYSGVDEQTGFTTRSILCAPLTVRDQCLGAIELVNKLSDDGKFSEGDLHLLQGLSSSAALAIVNARQSEALLKQERVNRELELAAEIQRSLLPRARPEPFPVHGLNLPAGVVSGDFYDFFELDDGRICFTLGDVSGKGINAALLMAKTASLYRALGKTIHEPGRLLAVINNEICETATRGMFVTMVGGVLDPGKNRVCLANAGHEPPLYQNGAGDFQALEAQAPPLGILRLDRADQALPEQQLSLEEGSLFLFSDGVTEGALEDGTTFRVEGIKSLLTENACLPPADRLNAVVARLRRANKPLRDDVTLLVVRGRESVGEATGEGLLRVNFPSRPDELRKVRWAVSRALASADCAEDEVRDMILAIGEACQNIIRHAYHEDPHGEIVLELRRDGDRIIVLLRDFAATVDPSEIKGRELEQLQPGGLGVHLINEVMDETAFLPPPGNSGNLLRMIKRVGRKAS